MLDEAQDFAHKMIEWFFDLFEISIATITMKCAHNGGANLRRRETASLERKSRRAIGSPYSVAPGPRYSRCYMCLP